MRSCICITDIAVPTSSYAVNTPSSVRWCVTSCLHAPQRKHLQWASFSDAVMQDIHKGDGLKNPINRVYSTNAAEPWHVDDADVVGEPINRIVHVHD